MSARWFHDPALATALGKPERHSTRLLIPSPRPVDDLADLILGEGAMAIRERDAQLRRHIAEATCQEWRDAGIEIGPIEMTRIADLDALVDELYERDPFVKEIASSAGGWKRSPDGASLYYAAPEDNRSHGVYEVTRSASWPCSHPDKSKADE